MSEQVYNKLVRDNIPDINHKQGRTPVVRVLKEDEILPSLHKKLEEEVAEYLADENVEEIADILEVLYAIMELKGITQDEIKGIRQTKADKNGGFINRYFLEKVTE